MKILKHAFLTAAFCTLAHMASAQTVINLTGSTAFRASSHTAILAVLDNNASTRSHGWTGATLGSANQAIFKGKLGGPSGPDVIIRTSWSGSAAGVQAVTSGSNVNFLATGATTSFAGTANLATGSSAAVADFAMSDVFQASTNFKTPTLTTSIVAIVPFVFVGSKNLPAGVTTMTPHLFRYLWSNGFAPLAMFNNSAADEDKFIHPVGRDSGSGTRITTLAETGYGINIPVNQYNLTVSSGDVTTQTLADDPSIPGADGNGGASSGGTVAGWLNATTTAVSAANGYTTYYLSYLGLPDATTAYAAGAGAKYVAWNGVNYFNGSAYVPELIYNGEYTFWGYQHLYYLPATNTGDKATFITNFQSSLASNPGAAGLNPASMRVNRAVDGGLVTPSYL